MNTLTPSPNYEAVRAGILLLFMGSCITTAIHRIVAGNDVGLQLFGLLLSTVAATILLYAVSLSSGSR